MASPAKTKKITIKIKPLASDRSPFVVNLSAPKPQRKESLQPPQSTALAARDAIKNHVGKFLESLPDIGQTFSTALERGLAGVEKQSARFIGGIQKSAASFSTKKSSRAKHARIVVHAHTPVKWQKPLITPETLSSWSRPSLKNLTEHAKVAAPKAIWEYGAMLFAAMIILSLPFQTLRAWSSGKTAQTEFAAGAAGVSADINFLKQTIASANLPAAGETLKSLDTRIDQIEAALQKLWPLSALPPLRTFRSLLKETNTSIGELTSAANILDNLGKEPNGLPIALHLLHDRVLSLSARIETIEKLVRKLSLPFLEKSNRFADSLGAVVASAGTIADSLEHITAALPAALGETSPKRYLLIFQNQNELRPTGGFLGSIAVIELKNGTIAKWFLPGGGSYDLQGQFTAQLASPHPLRLINPRFEFQDMNWFPDFPTSAQKLADTYEKAAGNTVDGVIAITGRVMENLLLILGPIEVPEFRKTVTRENFMEVTQAAVETDYDKTANQPKAFLGKLFEIISGRLASLKDEERVRVFMLAFQGLTEKDIQLFTRDEELEETLGELGWTGNIRNAPLDSLLLISANIGGGKTDAALERSIQKITLVREDGNISNTVRITFSHRGDPNNSWTRKRNTSYLRLYVPQGSILQSSNGFWTPPEYLFENSTGVLTQDPEVRAIERNATTGPGGTLIMEESGKTVFGNWIQIDAGQEKTVEFTYDLPQTLFLRGQSAPYTLLLQKQAGAVVTFTNTIIKEMAGERKTLNTETLPIDSDRFLTTVIR